MKQAVQFVLAVAYPPQQFHKATLNNVIGLYLPPYACNVTNEATNLNFEGNLCKQLNFPYRKSNSMQRKQRNAYSVIRANSTPEGSFVCKMQDELYFGYCVLSIKCRLPR